MTDRDVVIEWGLQWDCNLNGCIPDCEDAWHVTHTTKPPTEAHRLNGHATRIVCRSVSSWEVVESSEEWLKGVDDLIAYFRRAYGGVVAAEETSKCLSSSWSSTGAVVCQLADGHEGPHRAVEVTDVVWTFDSVWREHHVGAAYQLEQQTQEAG